MAILLVALPIAWLVFAQGIAAASRNVVPEVALARQPWDARAKAGVAAQLLARTPPEAAQARRLATEALRRDPTVVSAVRVLGLLATMDRQPDRALLFFRLSERLSRRDLGTQLWLIEERVAHNDIQRALGHYDIALRTASEAPDILLPILVAATREDSIARPLAAMLARDPPWRRAFLERLVGLLPDADKAVQLLVAVSAGRTPYEAGLMRDLLARLVDRRNLAAAARLYREVLAPSRRAEEANLLIRNGGFGRANTDPPFDWWLSSEADLVAELQESPQAGQGQSLALRATSAHGGVAARQILLLAPGDYELSFVAGRLADAAAAQVSVAVVCVTAQPRIILAVGARLGGGRQSALLHVPGDCPGQWLQIGIETSLEPEGVGAWIDSVDIRRRGPGPVPTGGIPRS